MKYHVEISGVREVSLAGCGDLSYWQEQLAPYDLYPSIASDRARLMICAVSARFKGIPFKELSVSVFVSQLPSSPNKDGAFLIHAFNSVRVFALCERAFFSTPYYHAGLTVQTGLPAEFTARSKQRGLLHACMSSTAREPSRAAAEGWAGPIFLPGRLPGKLFHGDLHGHTEAYPFEPTHDQLQLEPAADAPVIQQLLDSRFTPTEWLVREAAVHCKSKTVARDRVDGFAAVAVA